MPTPIRKKFCTIYRRTDFEKRAYETSIELDKTKKELEELRNEMKEMRKLLGNPSSNDTPPKRGRKKSSSEEDNTEE